MPRTPRPNAKTIGVQIRRAMVESGVRIATIAHTCDKSVDTVERWIAGTSDPSALHVWQIAQLTRKPFSFFAGETESPDRIAAVGLSTLAQEAQEIGERMATLLGDIRTHLAVAVERGLLEPDAVVASFARDVEAPPTSRRR